MAIPPPIPSSAPPPVLPPSSQPAGIFCEKCHGQMVTAKVPKLGHIVQTIGILFLIPTYLAIVTAIAGAVYVMSQAEPNQASKEHAGTVGFSIVINVLICAIPALLIGHLLAGSRKIWRCSRCGFFIQRA